jgi:RNA polymerase sigma-70 factor (ECF subfamily)
MAAAQAGNARAYQSLLKESCAWLRRYYARRLPASMAEDAAQETLIAVHVKRHTYDPARPFGPWLAAIARYKWIDYLRALKAGRTDAITEDLLAIDHSEATTSAAVLDRLLDTLKPTQSEVIRLVKLQGFSVEEAAARTGQSTSLVKVNIHRGLRRLTLLAQKEGGTEGIA